MLPTLPFGRTGHDSSRVLFGAAALAEVTQDEADRTVALLLDRGVNHIDVARSYGKAEVRLRPFLDRHRDEFFLATKTGDRTAEGAYAEINQSLERLGTDHVDLIQLHNLVDEIEWQTAYNPGGALAGAVRALDEGLVRAIGVTGHGVNVAHQHLRSLQEYDFASVLLPYNFTMARNPRYLADFEELTGVCADRGVAVQTIKAISRAAWSRDADRFAATWYEPLREQEDIDLAAHWVLGRPETFLLTTGDVEILPRLLHAAERFTRRPSDEEMRRLAERSQAAPLFV